MPLLATSPKNRVILGLMTFGPDSNEGARVTSLDEYNKVLDYFQSQGYSEVDTARVYVGGKQEAFSADAKWKERGLTLATKWYPHDPGAHKPEVLKSKVEESLKELKTDTVDIFYLHAADRSVPFTETLEAINEMHKQGKFVQFALSNFTAFEVAEVVITCKERGWVRPTLYQAMYNAISGLFSGKIKSGEIPAEGRYSDSVGKMGSMYRKRYFKDSTFDALRVIEPVVQKHNLTLLETALRWVTHHSQLKIKDGNDGVIIGVSSLDQLKSNLADLEKGPLPDEVVKVLDEAWMLAKAQSPNYWHLDLEYTYDTRKALFS
ncbi:MAG: hypothetical protein M1833_003894 [Piccolia ochrophora]|nr:MAG: hypothetical protein M1833_003894 [Piccolia ochrophora]